MALLEVKDLRVDFKVGKNKTVTAVQNVNFAIEKGQTLGVVGESGCGKSVTANTILRLLPAKTTILADGKILLDDKDISRVSDKEMKNIRGNKISMIFQEPMTSLNPVYTIGHQMVEMYQANMQISKKDAWEKGIEMLKKVGIPVPEQRMKEFPHQLSGGMRQRVMIAMALSTNPELLIADEPTTALDVTVQAQVFELMKKLQSELNTAILLITHDMGVVAEMSDYVMVMYAGEVVEYDSVENIFNNPMHPYTKGLLKSIPRKDQDVEKLHTIEGTVPALNEMPLGCHFSTRCQKCTEKCKKQKPELFQVGSRQIRCWKYETTEGTVE